MKKILLSFFMFLLMVGLQTSLAQEDEGVDEQTYRNPSYTQGTTQSIFEDGQEIYDSNWEWLHQSPQGNSLRWVKMWDANNWYAVGDGGTFMKTSDGGASWMVNIWINGGGSTNSNYDLYDAHFFDMNTGVAVGQNGKIVRTTDAGLNWDILDPSGATGTFYDVFFVNTTLGYACGVTSVDIWKTNDGGLTWTGPIVIPGTAYSIYAVDEDTIYHTSTSGNFRRSTDAGATWTTINVGFSTTMYDMNFTDPFNGWVCGSSANVAYTTDGGLTWTSVGGTNIPSTTTMNEVNIVSTMAQTLNEGFEDVTFPPAGWHAKNILGGVEWLRANGGHSGTGSALIAWEATGGEDWLVTPQLTISTGDSLKFWARKFFNSTYIPDSLQILVSNSDTSVAAFTTVIAAYDVNAFPYDWTTQYAVDLSAFVGMDIYIAFRHFDVDGNGLYIDDVSIGEPMTVDQVFVTGDAFNIFSTVDMGVTWTPVDFLGAQAWTGTYYSTDFLAADNFVTTGYRGLINEATSAAPPTCYTTYLKGGSTYDVWAHGVTGNVIGVGSGTSSTAFDQAMYSTDGGETWAISTILDTIDRDFNKISMVDSVTGYVAREDHYVSKTTDGGATWFPVTRAAVLTTDLETCSFVDENNGYVFGASGLGYKTTDGGVTWTTLTTGMGTSTIYGSFFLDASTGYICGASGKLFYTSDGGTTFTALTSNNTSTIRSIYMVNSNVGYLSGSSGKVRKTTDAGVTWDTVDVGNSSPTLYEIEFRNELNGMTVGSSGRTFYTNDGGVTWNFENTSMGTMYGMGLDQTSQDTIAAYVCGFGSYIMRNSHVLVPVELASFTASVSGNNVTINWMTATELNNFGFQVERRAEEQSWAKVGFVNGYGTTTEPQIYSFTDAGLASGTYSYRIKQIDYDGSYKYYQLENDVEIGVPDQFELSQNYPNPFNPTTKINYSVPVDGFVTISIFNILGEEVTTLINANVKAGNYEVTFDATNLASGMYLYRMESGDFISIKKMMILK